MSLPNPLQLLFQTASSTFSGFINFGSNIANGISAVVSAISNGLVTLSKAITNIPSEILTYLQNFGFALWHALFSVGQFLYSGFHDIASAIVGGIETIAKRLYSAFNNVITLIDTIRNDIHNWLTSLIPFFLNIVNIGIEAYNELKQIGATILNALHSFYNSLVPLFSNLINFLASLPALFSDLVNIQNIIGDIPKLVTEYTKQEASRIASAFPRVTGFNIAMEILKWKARKGFSGLTDAFLTPFQAMLAGAIVESLLKSFYPDATTTAYKTSISPTAPQATVTPIQPTSPSQLPTITTPQTSTPTQPSMPTPTSFEMTHPSVIGMNVEDQLTLSSQLGLANVGGFELTNMIQTLSDTFGVSVEMLTQIVRTLGVIDIDQFTPIGVAQTFISSSEQLDTLSISYSISTSILTPPAYLTWCIPTTPTPPSANVSDSVTVSETASVYESICIPIGNIASDEFIWNAVTNLFNIYQPNATDEFGYSAVTNLFNIYQPNVSDEFSYSATTGVLQSNAIVSTYSPSISLTQSG